MRNIPVLTVSKPSIAAGYEQALIKLFEEGIPISTQYDKDGESPSIDATMNITVDKPWSDPMIHKAFPGGIDSLREYVFELEGRKDHWVKNMNDPQDTRWEYTYHQRLSDWGTWYEEECGNRKKRSILSGSGGDGVDQVKCVVDKLAEQTFTRQAQMITWMPFMDFDVYDPPCLQSLWYRLLEEEGTYYLNCNVRFRSNDAWGANFMNMFGFVHFNKKEIADQLSRRLDAPVELGRLNWHADSYHLYGKDQKDFKERFWNRLEKTSFEDRIYNFHDDFIQEIWGEAEKEALERIRAYESRKESC